MHGGFSGGRVYEAHLGYGKTGIESWMAEEVS